MPSMNGIDATRRIKAKLPHVIIIRLWVNTSVAIADEMDTAGASAYRSKETAPEDLYPTIRATLTT